jgi:triphosphatase
VSDHSREIELKLDVDAKDVKSLRSGVLARLAGKGQTERLASVYYDTAKGDLRAAGVSLRVRTLGSDILQTVKRARGTSAGLFDRDEWEMPLTDRTPDLAAFARTPAGAAFDLAQLHLQPVFETRVDRTRWVVTTRGSVIEVALDSGRVVAGRRTEALAELELELKSGEPRDLFALVRDLADAGGVRPGVQAKSERGYRLAGGKPLKPVKAEPLRLTRDMTTGAAFQAIVHGCLRHFGLNVPIVLAKRSPEALHQARVALRRLRSALSLFQNIVTDEAFGPLKTALQAVSRDLGEARNLDVYLERSARPEAGRAPGEPGLQAFLRDMEARRSAAYDRLIERLQSRDFQQLLLRLVEWVEAGPWRLDDDPLRAALRDCPVRATAASLLRRQRRKVKRRGRHLADLDPHDRHRVRIDAKKLRYAAEFFAGLATGRKAAQRLPVFLAALEEMQDHLGALNDIQTGHDIAASFATGEAAGAAVGSSGVFAAAHVSGRQDAEVERLVAAAAEAHRALRKTKAFWAGWDA